MTIDEAIIQFKEDAECNREDLDLSWAEENEQVAKWLEELKDYRDKNKMVVKVDMMNIQELKDKILESYKQGGVDAERDFQNSDYWNDYLAKVIADAKAEAVDEYKRKIEFEHKWLLDCKVFDTNVDLAFETLKCYAEQLKEKNKWQEK